MSSRSRDARPDVPCSVSDVRILTECGADGSSHRGGVQPDALDAAVGDGQPHRGRRRDGRAEEVEPEAVECARARGERLSPPSAYSVCARRP